MVKTLDIVAIESVNLLCSGSSVIDETLARGMMENLFNIYVVISDHLCIDHFYRLLWKFELERPEVES